jgi:hypothetical protein
MRTSPGASCPTKPRSSRGSRHQRSSTSPDSSSRSSAHWPANRLASTFCTHDIARRLLPDLPRRGVRALTGYFGRGAQTSRCGRCACGAAVSRRASARGHAPGICPLVDVTCGFCSCPTHTLGSTCPAARGSFVVEEATTSFRISIERSNLHRRARSMWSSMAVTCSIEAAYQPGSPRRHSRRSSTSPSQAFRSCSYRATTNAAACRFPCCRCTNVCTSSTDRAPSSSSTRSTRRVHGFPVHSRHSSPVSGNTRWCESRQLIRGCSRAVPASLHRGRDLRARQFHFPFRPRRNPHCRPAPGRRGHAERTHSSPPSVAASGRASDHVCRVDGAHVTRRSPGVERIRCVAIGPIAPPCVRVSPAPCRPMITRTVSFGDADAMTVHTPRSIVARIADLISADRRSTKILLDARCRFSAPTVRRSRQPRGRI